jgi:hypothetical protein
MNIKRLLKVKFKNTKNANFDGHKLCSFSWLFVWPKRHVHWNLKEIRGEREEAKI